MKKYTLSLLFALISFSVFSQIEVKYFNAGWNGANDVDWVQKLSDCNLEKYDIVGPICETGDRIGSSRLFPKSYEGDILLIENAGAYGQTMSSHYNLREKASELLI